MGKDGIEGDIPETIKLFRDMSLSRIFRGITLGEYAMLNMMQSISEKSRCGGVYVTEIAERLKTSVPAVSKTLKALEAKGLVKRETDPENRRKTFVFLTEEGLGIKKNSDKEFSLFFTRVCKKVGKEDLDQFNQLARKISAAIFDELNANKRRGETDAKELLRNHA